MTKLLKALFITILSIAFILFAIWFSARRITEQKRTAWKGPALQRLTKLSITNEPIHTELQKLKTSSEWTSDHVLLMANGEYIIYEYRHGRNGYFPPHLFLGRASNGQWLYSSFHFCNNMNMIAFEPQPKSIADFAKKYFARPFDGKSDVCLKLTQ
jgi:hypothetical protein